MAIALNCRTPPPIERRGSDYGFLFYLCGSPVGLARNAEFFTPPQEAPPKSLKASAKGESCVTRLCTRGEHNLDVEIHPAEMASPLERVCASVNYKMKRQNDDLEQPIRNI